MTLTNAVMDCSSTSNPSIAPKRKLVPHTPPHAFAYQSVKQMHVVNYEELVFSWEQYCDYW